MKTTFFKYILSFSTIALLLIVALGCKSTPTVPRVTLEQIPPFPGATPLPPGQHVVSAALIEQANQNLKGIRRQDTLGGAHSEASFRISAKEHKYGEGKLWYFNTLKKPEWQHRSSFALDSYDNLAGQVVTVQELADPSNKDEFELLVALDNMN